MICSSPREDRSFRDPADQRRMETPEGWVDRLEIVRANIASIKLEWSRGTPVDKADIDKMEAAIARLEREAG